MISSDAVQGIYGEITRKVTKEKSVWVTDEESGQFWDAMAKDIAAILAENPKAIFDMVPEIP